MRNEIHRQMRATKISTAKQYFNVYLIAMWHDRHEDRDTRFFPRSFFSPIKNPDLKNKKPTANAYESKHGRG